MDEIADLQAWVEEFLREPAGPEPTTGLPPGPDGVEQTFSPFNREHMRRARIVAEGFVAAAATAAGVAGLEAVRQAAESAVQDGENPALVRHALALFLTHDPNGQHLAIPPLHQLAPEWVVPSKQRQGAQLEVALPLGGPESKLDWFREDPSMNDHHIHWHRVYPLDGPPTAPERAIRRGELFFYMHQQMLARYDTERVGAGLDPTAPLLPPYTEALKVGYDTNIAGFADRPVNIKMSDSPVPDLTSLPGWWRNLRDAARNRKLRNGDTGMVGGVDRFIDVLGSVMESNPESRDPDFYGDYHNTGHGVLAWAHFRTTGERVGGVMRTPATAMRDPVFYRWHKHIDSLAETYQDGLGSYTFAADAPAVRLRKAISGQPMLRQSPDIILCALDNAKIPGSESPTWNGQAFGEQTFGGAHWGEGFAATAQATDTLQTTWSNQAVELSDGRVVNVPHLDLHKQFAYFIRAENLRNTAQPVTVRIFLAATRLADQRRMWIEMDKFEHTLAPSAREVIFRPSGLSSVVRRSTVKARLPTVPGVDSYCDCGWPYSLLLPKGTPAGMPFRLFVMLTDAEQDLVDVHCGSTSFCGARDRAYPDRRPMGYPFDRKFAPSITGALGSLDNAAFRDVTIRYVGT